MRKRNSGVTLIELMIVVAIVAILASIALPSYRVYMLRTHRAQAKAALMQIQVAQEKFFLQKNRYVSTTSDMTTASPTGLGIPGTTENGMYTITIASGSTDTNYTAVATARSSQTDDTACPVFTIDETGSKTPVSGECWK